MPTYNFIGGLGGDDISETQVEGIFAALAQVGVDAGDLPRVSFLGIDSPADTVPSACGLPERADACGFPRVPNLAALAKARVPKHVSPPSPPPSPRSRALRKPSLTQADLRSATKEVGSHGRHRQEHDRRRAVLRPQACAGCGGSLAVRAALKVLGPNAVAALPAGCMSAVGFNFPQLAFAEQRDDHALRRHRRRAHRHRGRSARARQEARRLHRGGLRRRRRHGRHRLAGALRRHRPQRRRALHLLRQPRRT